MDIENTLRDIIKEIDDSIDVNALTRESSLKEDLGLSSVAMLYVAVAIEDKFKVDLSNTDLSSLETVGDVVALLEK